jgi:hypothetical protein
MRARIATCWQCGEKRRVRLFDAGGPWTDREFRRDLKLAGWYLHCDRMIFCPMCRRSAKLALGVGIDDAV